MSGVCSAGLRDRRAAGGGRRGDLPDRHQQREVRDDLRADADGLLERVAEEVPRGHRERLALDLRRPAGVVAQVGDRGGDVALGGRERLAVVERLELGELGAVRLDQLGERYMNPRASTARPPQPALERGAGGADGAIDVLGPALVAAISSPVAGSIVSNVRRRRLLCVHRRSGFAGPSSTKARASDSDWAGYSSSCDRSPVTSEPAPCTASMLTVGAVGPRIPGRRTQRRGRRRRDGLA